MNTSNEPINNKPEPLSPLTEAVGSIKKCFEDGDKMKLMALVPLGRLVALEKAIGNHQQAPEKLFHPPAGEEDLKIYQSIADNYNGIDDTSRLPLNLFKESIGQEYTPVHFKKHEATEISTIQVVMAEFKGTKAADVIAELVFFLEIERQRTRKLSKK